MNFLSNITFPRKHSSRMRIPNWPTVQALVAIRCQYYGGGGGPQVNKFQQASSLGHQMSLEANGGPCTVRSHVQREGGQDQGLGWGQGAFCMVRSNASWGMVTCPLPPVNRQTPLVGDKNAVFEVFQGYWTYFTYIRKLGAFTTIFVS